MRLFVLTLVLASGGFALAWSLAASSNGANCRHSHAPICATTATSGKTTTSTPAGSSGICGTYASQAAPATVSHVIWIWMENHSYSEIIGSSSAPYINRLASQCGLATNFFAESHPSLPNYIAATSGSTQGITDDALPSSHPLNVSSIFGQVGPGMRGATKNRCP